jgi:hypothetical protein
MEVNNMPVISGKVGKITVSGSVVSGTSGAMEATVTVGKETAKHNPVGTDVSEHLVGMKTVEGVIRKPWVSGDTLLQDLLNSMNEFAVKIEGTGTYGGMNITASGCIPQTITRRLAPGTEMLMEEMPFVGRDWY